MRFAGVLRLSRAEFRVMYLLAEGLTVKEIAAYPGHHRSVKTIYTSYERMKAKLGFTNLNQMVAFAAAYRESGLRRKINENYAPYVFE